MLRTTWLLARGTAARRVAAGSAIALGTAFAAVVLLGTGLVERTAGSAVAAEMDGADVVVTAPDPTTGPAMAPEDLSRVRELPGVAGADGRRGGVVEVVAGARTRYAAAEAVPTAPALAPVAGAGRLPRAADEVAVSGELARGLRLRPGADVVVRSFTAAPDGGTAPTDRTVRLVGVLDGGSGLAAGATVVATADRAEAWSAVGSVGAGPHGTVGYASLLVVAAPGTGAEELRDRVADALAGPGGQVRVETAEQSAAAAVAAATGDAAMLTSALLAFAVLALLVAGAVIANTFAVVVAQRTRELALLRCVGATAGQVARTVLAEALALGLLASLLGTALGTGLAAAAAAVLAATVADVPVPGTVEVTAASVLVPVGLGVLTTVLAALAPARAATRVPALAALRPAGAPDLARRGSRVRVVASCAGGVLGLSLVAVAVAWPGSGSVLLALAGAAVSFAAVLVGAVFVVPPVIAAAGRAAGGAGGGVVRLAAVNAARNPRRTATTTGALLIGTTLVACVVVGAASSQRALADEMDRTFPVDVSVGASGELAGGAPGAAEVPLPAALAPAVADVEGVRAVVALPSVPAQVGGKGGSGSPAPGTAEVVLRGVDPREAGRVLTDTGAVTALQQGSVLVPDEALGDLGGRDGAPLRLVAGGREVVLTARASTLPGSALVAPVEALEQLAPGAAPTRLWVALAPGADAAASVEAVRDAVGTVAAQDPAAAGVAVEGAAVERAGIQQLVDTLLLVVVALLAVAVVIALVGVANTLSLSVVERTAESAVLRALGTTRGQLRGMLAAEGALVAGVGSLLGAALGSLYGWAGAAALLGGTMPVEPVLPVGRLALLLAVAVVAGLLASVLPARRAAAAPPVAALAG